MHNSAKHKIPQLSQFFIYDSKKYPEEFLVVILRQKIIP